MSKRAKRRRGAADRRTKGPAPLEGDRVRLVPLKREHLARTRSWANDPQLKAVMLRTLPVTARDQANWYRALRGDASKVVFAVLARRGGAHVGNAGLYEIDPICRRASLWLLLGDRASWGRGLGTEVVALLARYAFIGLGLHRLHLHVGAHNRRAVALYRKMGFVHEGTLRRHFLLEGRYVDVHLMGLLRDEWTAAQDASLENRHAVQE